MSNKNEGTKFTQGVDDAITSLEGPRRELREAAKALVDEFWVSHFKGNKGEDFKRKSIMGVRLRPGQADEVYIQWFWNKWIKTREGKTQTISTYIRKGRTNKYSDWSLEKYARDWERELVLVLELEARFAEIRSQMRELKLAELALRRALKQYRDSQAQADET